MPRNIGWLVSEFDYRDPEDDLHEIDCGRALQTLSSLPGYLRQLLQEGDMFVELAEEGEVYEPTKIIKKREAEYSQGTERHFLITQTGDHIPVSEDELDEYLNNQGNPEDIYNQDEVEFVSISQEYTCPRDTWDLLYDRTIHRGKLKQLLSNEQWQSRALLPRSWYRDRYKDEKDLKTRREEEAFGDPEVIERLKKADLQWLKDEFIYSAGWFPYPEDKRIHHSKAKRLADRIKRGELDSKQELAKAIGGLPEDRRPSLAKQMKAKAKVMSPGTERVKLFCRAQAMLLSSLKDKRKSRSQISQSDKKKLWSLWYDTKARKEGKVELPAWLYRKRLFLSLIRKGMQVEEAEQRANFATKKHFDIEIKSPLFPPQRKNLPVPISNKVGRRGDQQQQEEEEFSPVDWLEPQSLHNFIDFREEEDDS